jgi:hypothetical protein
MAEAPPATILKGTTANALSPELVKEYGKIQAKLPPTVKDVTVHELHSWLTNEDAARSTVLVDVRDEDEMAVSRLPGAITKSQFETSKEQHKDSKVVCYW